MTRRRRRPHRGASGGIFSLSLKIPPLAVVLLAGCAGGEGLAPRPSPAATATPRADRPPLARPRCRDDVPRCASTSGRIVFVERVDPDGDGDLHLVVADRRGVTLRGLTAIDVSKRLRPRRDPRIGERAAAMGPVQPGSYGQDQIHALVFRTRR